MTFHSIINLKKPTMKRGKYNIMRDKNQLKFPMGYEVRIDKEDPVRKLVEICEELDYTRLLKEYERAWRKTNPITLFQVLVLGYMTGNFSSRKIESACRNDIRFLWLLEDESCPDHSTIARFQNKKLTPVIEELFYQLINKLMELGEVEYKNVFIDGTKIEANANRYSFVWKKSVERNKKRLQERIELEVPVIAVSYGYRDNIELENLLENLKNMSKFQSVIFVYGSGKRKAQIQRDIERLSEYSKRMAKYSESMILFAGRNSYSKTDKDATFMRMKDDHMKNGQLKAGYNVQLAVESEYIVGLKLFPNPGDVNTLVPFLESMKSASGRMIENVVADAGYESEENYTYLERNHQSSYIKPSDYERQKRKKYRENIYRADNFAYEEQGDFYTCPNNKKLEYIYDSKKKMDSGFISIKRNYRCEDCSGCFHRELCYKGAYENRKISISHTFLEQRRRSQENITSTIGISLRMNRSIQVEGAFGVIKQNYSFTRFLTRGKQKNQTVFLLIAFAFNIKKLCAREKSGRFGKSLFDKMIA